MQLFALDGNGTHTSADDAAKQSDYFCLECSSVVRVRGGLHRRNHFYHIQPDRICRQNGKSLIHLQVQCAIRDRLPDGECQLERRFPQIGRIADAAWETQKIVFEVQCSDITAQEIQERNNDYAKLGYHVVWILHDHRYNRWRMTAAEYLLLGSTHYYTNIGVDGVGIIYDQHASVRGGVKLYRSEPFPIDVSKPSEVDRIFSDEPLFLRKRLQKWNLQFSGDLLDQMSCNGLGALSEEAFLGSVEETSEGDFSLGQGKISLWQWMLHWKRCYRIFLRYFVEKSCR